MNLESRARRAVASLKASVAGATAPADGVAPHPRRGRLIGVLAVGAALAAAVLVVALLVLPSSIDLKAVAGPDLSPATTTPRPLDGTTTVPLGGGEPSSQLSGDYPGHGGPLGPSPQPPGTIPGGGSEGDGQSGSNPGVPNHNGSEADDSDLPRDFWASQAYGCSAEESPVELFFGGGRPGETITLDSPYGSAAAVVGEDGYWEATIAFSGAVYGEPFTVTVTTGAGEIAELLFVIADPASGECTPPMEYWFSAYQMWGCSIEDPPSDLFYGTGVPGDTITLDSPYGGGTVGVDESGWWEITLTFPEAPLGETFTVTATDGTSEVWELYFTAADPEDGTCLPPEDYWFSAYQGRGCSLETPPADFFYGTGFPGDTITITSPYGLAEAVVDEWGWWEATVNFAGAPIGEPFDIEVAAPDGDVWAFSFIAPDPQTGSCWVFSAYQGAGCSVDDPPTEYFWGTGDPGGLVAISSPYGGTEAVIDEGGYWEATVLFAGAPVGEAFTIAIAGPDGTVWAFPFIVADPDDGTCWGAVEPCPPGGDCDVTPTPLPAPAPPSPAYVESVEFLSANTNPARVSVVVEGYLPTPCHTPAWDLSSDDTALLLDVYALAGPEEVCAQVVVSFTATIDLGEFAPGWYVLYVNGRGYPFAV